MPQQDPILYITIVVYLVFLLVIGVVVKRFSSDTKDYFRAGSQGTWWLVGMSAFMSSFSAWTFTGAASRAYTTGWSVAWVYIGAIAGWLLNVFWFAAWFRQLRATTAPEVIRLRFGPATQQFYAITNALLNMLYSVLALFGLCVFSTAVFGLPMHVMIVVLGLVALICSTVGGNWAVMVTEFLQGLILIPVTLVVGWLSWRALAASGGLAANLHQAGLTDQFALVKSSGAEAWPWIVALFINQVLNNTTMTVAPRFFTARDGRAASQAAAVAAGGMIMGTLVWLVPPMYARLAFSAEVAGVPLGNPAEASYAITCMKLLPVGCVGLVVVAMFSATVALVDTGLNKNAAIIVHDIYPLLMRLLRAKCAEGQALLRLSRVVTGLLGLILVTLTLVFASRPSQGIFNAMLDIGAYLGAPMAVPLVLGLLIRRTPSWAALASVGGGGLASLGVAAWRAQTGSVPAFETVFALTAGTAALVFVASVLWRDHNSPAAKQQAEEFFRRMDTPVDFAREVGVSNNTRQLRTVGIFALALAALISLLTLTSQSGRETAIILTIAGFSLATGLLLIASARQK